MTKISIGYQLLIAFVLGVLNGLFFGPLTVAFKPIAETYTMLLQMVVLPYICFSLIHGLGSITPAIGKKLFKSSWPFLALSWGVILLIVYIAISLIPQTHSPLIEIRDESDFLSQFSQKLIAFLIPENPIYDIANNVVPAIAVFGLIIGMALMHIEKKEPLISFLERVNQTIEKLLYWIGLISPIGVFAYISMSFGTIHFEDLIQVGLFVSAFVGITFFVTLWILPSLLIALTPLTRREVFDAFRSVCILPFLTGLTSSALPFLTAYLKKLSKKHEENDKFRETSQTILPIAYGFGNLGNALILFFIFFLGYYYRHPFTSSEKILLPILTIPLSIGSSSNAMNSTFFLIHQLGFPEGASDFFLKIKSLTYNFQILLSVSSILTLILLSVYSYYGLLRIRWKSLILRTGFSLVLFAAFVFALKPFIHPKDLYQNLYMHLQLSDVIENPVGAEFLSASDEGAPRIFDNTLVPNTFKQILNTKILKVGYNPYQPPFSYFNSHNELVGYDIAYAYQLARDLECTLQFYPLQFNEIGADLLRGAYDIGMCSINMSEGRLRAMDFTFPYYQDNNVVLVPVAKKHPFLSFQAVQEMSGLKIGATGAQVAIAQQSFPKATLIDMPNELPFLAGEVDLYVWSETMGKVWCLTHNQFVAINYGEQLGKSYFAYPIREHATDFGFFLNNWLNLKEQSGFKKAMSDYWIEGISPNQRPPRWSILRNVLHWID